MCDEKSCKACMHSCIDDFNGRYMLKCTLKNLIPYSDLAKDCNFYNVDTSDMYICGNCRFFAGGGDWGLACSKFYYQLPIYTDDACDEFEWFNSRK